MIRQEPSLTQGEKGRTFRALHERNRAFIIPNPWDVGTARLLAQLGFEALATTSAGYAFSAGQRDNVIHRDDMLTHVATIASATDLPVSADLENGFGDSPAVVAETFRLAAAAGLAGGSIEDMPRQPGCPIYGHEYAVERARGAAEVVRDLPFAFTLTARAENYLDGRPDLRDTIKRLQAYQEAGADVLYAPGLRSKDDIATIVNSVDRPVNVVVGLQGIHLSVAELSAIGVRRVSVGSALSRAALGAFLRAAREMREHGTLTFAEAAVSHRGRERNVSGMTARSRTRTRSMKHAMVQANGASFHTVETGHGAPLLFLHGWPEFWLTWEPVMARLADRYRLIAPDLRGFGDSDKPHGPFGAQDHAADMLALLDARGIERVGLIGYDVGGAAMQPLARKAPERVVGLFFFDFVYPGIGSRMAAPDRLNEIWYQSFNQMEMAPTLVGASQDTCRAYISHFLRHWAYRKHAFDDVLSAFIENFMKPGNLAGGFAHYKASHAGRVAMMKGQAQALPPITPPTCVRWPERDPLCPYEWTDRLDETFVNLDLALFPNVGHFPHREDPDRAAIEIAAFFDRLGWR